MNCARNFFGVVHRVNAVHICKRKRNKCAVCAYRIHLNARRACVCARNFKAETVLNVYRDNGIVRAVFQILFEKRGRKSAFYPYSARRVKGYGIVPARIEVH